MIVASRCKGPALRAIAAPGQRQGRRIPVSHGEFVSSGPLIETSKEADPHRGTPVARESAARWDSTWTCWLLSAIRMPTDVQDRAFNFGGPLRGGDSPSSTGRNRSAAEPREPTSVPLNCLSCWLATLLRTMQTGFGPWEAAGGAKQCKVSHRFRPGQPTFKLGIWQLASRATATGTAAQPDLH